MLCNIIYRQNSEFDNNVLDITEMETDEIPQTINQEIEDITEEIEDVVEEQISFETRSFFISNNYLFLDLL
jgi:hypothetical protein